MKIGRLRHRVTIQRLTTAQDSYGEPVETWADVAVAWALMAPSMRVARESFAAASEQRIARQPMECRMRYRSDLSPATSRLLWRGESYDIEGVMDPDGRGHELVIFCYGQG